MKFRTWIYEGFGVDYENLPEPFRKDTFDADSILAKRGRQKLVGQVFDSNAIDFHPEDRPQDFIKVQTVNKLTKFDPPQPLKSFEGSEILYGMRFNANSNLLEEGFAKEVDRLKTKMAELIKAKKEADRNGKQPVQDIVVNVYNDMIHKGADNKTIERIMPQMVQARIAAAGLANKSNQSWNLQKMMNIVKLSQKKPEEKESSGKIGKKIDALKVELETAVKRLNAIPRMCFIIEQAFLKKIKHPVTADDNQLCDHFVRLAVENYTKSRGNYHYDYVLYPESSSELNTKIATALAAEYGAVPIKGFQKVANPKIDTTSYINQYPGKPDELITPEELGKSNLRQGATPPQTSQMKSGYWKIFNDLQGKINRSNGQIKNVDRNQSFIRNLQMNPTVPQQVTQKDQRSQFRNRRLLVIDDNTRSGATFQTINHMLRDRGPQSIHYYTPLLADFTYGTGKETTDVPKNLTPARQYVPAPISTVKPPTDRKPNRYVATPKQTAPAINPHKDIHSELDAML